MLTDIEAVATDIVDAAIKVHRELVPGLLESAYQHCHSHELRKREEKFLQKFLCHWSMMGRQLILDTGSMPG